MPSPDPPQAQDAANPLASRTAGPMQVDPHLFVVLGATGDLVGRLVLPALCRLAVEGRLGGQFVVLGAALPEDIDDGAFRAAARQSLSNAGLADADAQRWCDERIYYQPLPAGGEQPYRALAGRIAALEASCNLPGNRVFYLALPPEAVPSTVQLLGQTGLNRSPGWKRLVVEKPFGWDLPSAQELNRTVHRWFDESQIYRIDHFLGKETVQNLLAFRFANAMFESIWNRDRIAAVGINVAETLGVEHRAAYYERAGALRDMVQNHLTQLLSVTAMELPAAFDSDAIRYEKAKVLRAVAPIRPEDVVRGQYGRGRINGAEVPAYREEPGVKPDSDAETFVSLKLEIANWRWQGVPFYLRTGKRLPRRVSQIVVTFRPPPVSIFQPLDVGGIRPNALVIALQPDEGFDLQFEVKVPGQLIRLAPQSLHFRYAEVFAPLPTAYETLVHDVMLGDQALFVSANWTEESWRLYTPLLERPSGVLPYAAGTWGPAGVLGESWPPAAAGAAASPPAGEG